MFIFSNFLTFFQNSEIKSSYTAIINAIQTAVIDQFIALKTEKINFI